MGISGEWVDFESIMAGAPGLHGERPDPARVPADDVKEPARKAAEEAAHGVQRR